VWRVQAMPHDSYCWHVNMDLNWLSAVEVGNAITANLIWLTLFAIYTLKARTRQKILEKQDNVK
jgi:hypothetical protein